MIFYLIFKSVNDGIRDFFGVSKLFNGKNIEFIYTGTEFICLISIFLIISLKIRDFIRNM